MSSQQEIAAHSKIKLRSRPLVASIILFGGFIAVVLGLAVSVSVGAADIKLATVWEAIFYFDLDLTQHQIIRELRLPRAVAGALVGACFAVAGAIMQGMTRNPLAEPGLLGINAGSGFALALVFAFFPGLSFLNIMLFSCLGAGVGAILVYGIGSLSRGGLTPVRLVLAGAAVSALLVALSEGVAIYYRIGQDLAFWYAGGLAGTKWLQIKIIIPWIGGGLLVALLLSKSITLLSLGEDVAIGLGLRTRWIKLIGMLTVLVLAGVSVSVVGSVGFVGLIIPHLSRFLVGVDYRWIIPCSAILGSLLIILADIGARMVNPPFETPVGAIIALVGVPFFLYLSRKEGREL
ncbi:iron ABC transporter permease [Paenibacillus psychroresistens]|uniref:Iron ABC transporter permease n=1 Tax=Paenibacillus psychroresistens TaxID=1778678 RepID=A0A6B8RSD4_9BACL|nr:iron ABC transporter permease [Paenibacillus psychroresistens]QGQ98849.1 iron ABC transporter permease [Paenibacillus psychroresistens]